MLVTMSICLLYQKGTDDVDMEEVLHYIADGFTAHF